MLREGCAQCTPGMLQTFVCGLMRGLDGRSLCQVKISSIVTAYLAGDGRALCTARFSILGADAGDWLGLLCPFRRSSAAAQSCVARASANHARRIFDWIVHLSTCSASCKIWQPVHAAMVSSPEVPCSVQESAVAVAIPSHSTMAMAAQLEACCCLWARPLARFWESPLLWACVACPSVLCEELQL